MTEATKSQTATPPGASSVGVWLHGESLSQTDPAVLANPTAPRLFVFDRPLLAKKGYSFKRIFFIYECAAEALGPEGELRLGNVADEIAAFCSERGLTAIHTTHPPSNNPRFSEIVRRVRAAGFAVTLHEQEPLAVAPRGRAFERFSRYWHAVEDQVMQPKGAGPL